MNSDGNSSVHYRNCNLSEAICGIEITRDGDRLSIRGDKDDPFSRGFICPKAVALQDIHFDKDRLKQPVRRTTSALGTCAGGARGVAHTRPGLGL